MFWRASCVPRAPSCSLEIDSDIFGVLFRRSRYWRVWCCLNQGVCVRDRESGLTENGRLGKGRAAYALLLTYVHLWKQQ